MTMKFSDLKVKVTQDELMARIEKVRDSDIFGEYVPMLAVFLDYAHIKLISKKELTEEEWNKIRGGDQQLQEHIQRYMTDWWKKKVEDGRGISVHRGRAQVVNLLFVAGVEEWKRIGLDVEECGFSGGWYQEEAYNIAADLFGLPHIRGYREGESR